MLILNRMDFKTFRSSNYNYDFRTADGLFRRWGRTPEEDPFMSPFGPETADIEVSTSCNGPRGVPCRYCYKSNTSMGKNMPLDLFKRTLDKLPDTLVQVALGIGDLGANSDLRDIMRYCRNNDIVPNITINGAGLSDRRAAMLAELCGAVAVSAHDFEVCFNAVQKLYRYGSRQVNIHALTAASTMPECENLLKFASDDPRLRNLNAVVFLALKRIGQRNDLHPVSEEQFGELVRRALDSSVKIGFDSCSAPAFINAIQDREDRECLEMLAEPCESYLFSIYIDVRGRAYPCSFCSGMHGGQVVADCKNFLHEIWLSENTETWRRMLKMSGRRCPVRTIHEEQEHEN